MMIQKVQQITNRITMSVFGTSFRFRIASDDLHDNGRIFLQVFYTAPCSKTGTMQDWRGRKWYLSEFMTDDEVIKTAYTAFEYCVKHEVMEGFKVDNTILFNPHVNYEALLSVSNQEIKRA
jgi:hypothetical protein